MDLIFRPAKFDDIPDLSRLHLVASHGFFDAVYHNVVPGLATNLIYERVLARAKTVRSYENASVAVVDGQVVGEVHAYSLDDAANEPPDPLLPKNRLRLFEPFNRLNALATGTYRISVLAVYPEYRGNGIGANLMELAHSKAKQRGFLNLSLFVFEGSPAVNLYLRLGYAVAGRSPIVKNDRVHASGDLLLMTATV